MFLYTMYFWLIMSFIVTDFLLLLLGIIKSDGSIFVRGGDDDNKECYT